MAIIEYIHQEVLNKIKDQCFYYVWMLLYRIHRMYGGGGRRRNDLFEEIKQWFHEWKA